MLTDKKTIISIRDLKKEFDGAAVLDDISLDLYENEIFCVLGHNGAGKTTLINLLGGIL
jgi:ABC-type multidrug transport system ATPase subunit